MRTIPFLTSSILNQYINCKFAYYKAYIENNGYDNYRNDDDFEPIYLTFGTLIHGVIEQFWKKSDIRTKQFLISTYEHDLVNYGLTNKQYIELGYIMLDNFFNYLRKEVPPRKAIHSELGFNVKIGGLPLHGHIDQVFYHGDGIYEIEDYKTSKWVKPQDEVDEDIQLSMYDLVFSNKCMRKYWYKGIEPKGIILTLHFLRYGKVVRTERTEYSRLNALSYFRLMYKQMQHLEDNKFIPTLNNFCSFCDFKYECPLYKSVIDDTYKFPNMKEFNSKAEWNLAMYEDLKTRARILSNESDLYHEAVCDYLNLPNSTPLSYNGHDYFMFQSGRRYVKTDVAINILKEYDMWQPEYFINSLSLSKLEELIKQNPDVEKRINAFAIGFSNNYPSLTSKKSPKLFKRSGG